MNKNTKKQVRGAVPQDTGRQTVDPRSAETQAVDPQATETQTGDLDHHVIGDILYGFNAGTWKWNLQSGEVECSNRWAEIAGYPAEELSPSTIDSWMQMVHPDDVSTTQRASEEYQKGNNELYATEFRMRHKQGHWMYVLARGKVLSWSNDGKPLVIAGIHQDITERKLSEERMNRLTQEFEKVFNGTQSSMFLTEYCDDGSFRYVRINKAYERTSGLSPEETIGSTPQELYGKEQGDEIVSHYMRCINKKTSQTFEANVKLRGRTHIVTAELTPLWEGGRIKYIVGSSTDVTEKKKILNELVEAKEKAEASDRLKTAFLNNISHEIRTPLNGILGFGQLMAQNATRQQLSYFNNMQISSRRLIDTINKITDISLLWSGNMKVHKEKASVPAIMKEMFDQFEPLFREKNMELLMHLPDEPGELKTDTDPELLRKVWLHLLDNALKFSEKGQTVMAAETQDQHILCSVKDSGRGIDQNYMPEIFDPFSQEDTETTRGYEGSGLGLAIVRGIMQKLGGDIRVESEKNKGSTFYFKLPALEKPISRQDTPGMEAGAVMSEEFSILIADDDEMARFLLETLLENTTARLILTSDGQQAVKKFSENPGISLVLMDIKMPVMDGLTATKKIKQIQPEVPVIALTAHAMSGDEARIKAAGCDDYIPKPFSSSVLFEKIKRFYPSFSPGNGS